MEVDVALTEYEVPWAQIQKFWPRYTDHRALHEHEYGNGLWWFGKFLTELTGRRVDIDAPMDDGKYEYIAVSVLCDDDADFIRWKLTWL